MIVRPAAANDIPAVARLGALLMRAHHVFDSDRFMKPGTDAEEGYGWFLQTQLDDPTSLVLVAEHDGVIVGYVYAGIEPRSWKELREEAGFIHDLLVDEDSRGHGIAEALVAAAIDALRARGVPRVLLWTASPNAQARRLFERMGFRSTMIEMTRELPAKQP